MAADNTTTAAKSNHEELDEKDSRRITITMKKQVRKGVPQVEHPPELSHNIMEIIDQPKRERADIKNVIVFLKYPPLFSNV